MDTTAETVVGDATKARFISTIIDNIIAIFLTILIVGLVPEDRLVLRGVLLFAAYLGYYFAQEALWSRTLGKFLQGLMVRKLDGTHGDWKTALIRTLFRIVEVNPLLLGALPAGLILISSARKQRLGDMLAGSIVVSSDLRWREGAKNS